MPNVIRSLLSCETSSERNPATELKGISPASPQGKMSCSHKSSSRGQSQRDLCCPSGMWHSLQEHFLSLLADSCGKVNDNEVFISAAVSPQWSLLSYLNGSTGYLQSEVLAESLICSEPKLGIFLFLKAKTKMPIFNQIWLLTPFTFYSIKTLFQQITNLFSYWLWSWHETLFQFHCKYWCWSY